MEAFVAVVDAGSFANASNWLNMTPSAVSKVVSRLEARLGVQLLARTTRKLTLTDAGAVFLHHARATLYAAETAFSQVAALDDEPSGTVVVSVGSAYAKHQLVPRLPRFHNKYPKVTVELNVTDALVDPRFDGVDVAIRPGGFTAHGLHTTPLGSALRHLCASPAYLARKGNPRTPDDLALHDCLVMTGDKFQRWPFRVNGRVKDVSVTGPVRADNADMLLDLALADHGIVRLLDTIVGKPLQNGTLVPILENTHVAEIKQVDAFVRRGRELLPRIAALLTFLSVEH
ncbi:MAG: LysR family transcriptional regulator [Pseudoruegeria sp.]